MAESQELNHPFFNQIQELIEANAWNGLFMLEWMENTHVVRIRLSSHHPVAPGEIVNDYRDGVNPLEQIQQECFRSLRTGNPGI